MMSSPWEALRLRPPESAARSTEALSLAGGNGTNQVVSTADADFTLADWALKLSTGDSYALTSIQQAILTGGPNDNRFDISGFTGTATLTGGGGIDTLASFIAVNATLTDASFSRTTGGTFALVGITRAALTASPTGNHAIDGSGFSGNLTAYAGGGSDAITGGSGSDYIVGGAGKDTLSGGPGNDIIYGGSGVGTSIDGGSGDDILYGSTSGSSTMTGGPGDDRIVRPRAPTTCSMEAPAIDIIYGGTGGDIISGESGSDTLIGGPGAETIYGNNSADSGNDHAVDTLYAHYGTIGVTTPGVSHLYGQGANDLLYSGPADIISAGVGTNPFIDQGTPLGTNPNNFAAPPVFPAATCPQLLPRLSPQGVAVAGRWTELAGSAGPNGISGGAGQAIEPSIVLTPVPNTWPGPTTARASSKSTSLAKMRGVVGDLPAARQAAA